MKGRSGDGMGGQAEESNERFGISSRKRRRVLLGLCFGVDTVTCKKLLVNDRYWYWYWYWYWYGLLRNTLHSWMSQAE